MRRRPGGSGESCGRALALGSLWRRRKEVIVVSGVADGFLAVKVSNGTSAGGAMPSIAMAASRCVIAFTTAGAIMY